LAPVKIVFKFNPNGIPTATSFHRASRGKNFNWGKLEGRYIVYSVKLIVYSLQGVKKRGGRNFQ